MKSFKCLLLMVSYGCGFGHCHSYDFKDLSKEILTQSHLRIAKDDHMDLSTDQSKEAHMKIPNHLKSKLSFFSRVKKFFKNFKKFPYRATLGIVVVLYWLWPKPQDKKFLLEYLKLQE